MTDQRISADTFLAVARQLLQSGRFAEGERLSADAVARHPESPDLWNVRGVFMRRLGRPEDAVAALDRAIALKPGLVSARVNRGNVLTDLGRFDAAAEAFVDLAQGDPDNPLFLHLLGGGFARIGRLDEAVTSLRQVVALKPEDIEAWVLLTEVLRQAGRTSEADAVVDLALTRHPDAPPLMTAKVVLLRETGRSMLADVYLQELAERLPDTAWILFAQADLIWEADRSAGLRLFRGALALEPNNLDYLIGLMQALERTQGDLEAAALDEAHALGLRALALKPAAPAHTKVLRDVFVRVAAFAELDRLGDFKTLGRGWAGAGLHTALLKQMGRVADHADRVELVEQHRLWGEAAERAAAGAPVPRPPRASGGKIRLGFVSSDLRKHVVSAFAQPLFDHIDRERFEVFAYSFARVEADEVQAQIACQVDAFRWAPGMPAREAARMIASDALDFLVELGGSTNMNKLEVMAYKPAPLQASWLGYPHSTGLSTIDYFICDRLNMPTAPGLLLEKPLLLPDSWVTFGSVFNDGHAILPGTPEDRNGVLTFGSANSPLKYSREVLGAWARIVRETPGSRFAFVRPEAGSAVFRRHVLAEFAAEGVDDGRVLFHAVRGRHMAWYNEIDISLDTFPLTGGTTTAETLWMGVPVVSRTGEAFYERISYSILTNAGLGDLCAPDTEGYVTIARTLASDRQRRRDLRATLRQRIRRSALGRPEAFAKAFYDAVAKAVSAARP